MEHKGNFIEPLLERAESYGKTSLQLLKLKAVDKTADITSTFISRGIVVAVITLFIVIVNIGLALWIGDLLGKSYYGFFCVAAFYLILGGVLYFFMHETIKKQIGNSIVSQILN